MSDKSKIEWTDATWNPTRGCTKVSAGCKNCYAETFAERWRGIPGHPYEQGFDLRLVPDKLSDPLSWKKPRRIFVNSMSDLFHEGVPFEYIDCVFAVMNATAYQLPLPSDLRKVQRWHTYQILTKRPERMAEYLASRMQRYSGDDNPIFIAGRGKDGVLRGWGGELMNAGACLMWPMPNVWLGTSVENQETADQRIPELLKVPAAVRFLSCEPLLGPIRLPLFTDTGEDMPEDERRQCGLPATIIQSYGAPPGSRIDWVIAGGESGPNARSMHPDWVRSLRDQCTAAGVPFFFKQWGAWTEAYRFNSHHHWVNKASTHTVKQPRIYLGRNGRDCKIGADFTPEVFPVSLMGRVTKSAAGRELDGRTWDEYPHCSQSSGTPAQACEHREP
jgi:protein gp37